MAYFMIGFYIIVIQYIERRDCKIISFFMKDMIIINFSLLCFNFL